MNMSDHELMATQGYYTYAPHPIYSDYGSNTLGEIKDLRKNRVIKQSRHQNGYLQFMVRDSTTKRGQRCIKAHRFIYECHNGVITNGLVIDHINSNKADNILDNLPLVTQSENCKAAWNRGEIVRTPGRTKARLVIAISPNGTRVVYNSCEHCAKELGLCAPCVRSCLNGKQKSTTSRDGIRYTFEEPN